MTTKIWVNIGSGNGLLPDGTKPLPEPMLISDQINDFLWHSSYPPRSYRNISVSAEATILRRCDIAFIEPMHLNKPNITYLLTILRGFMCVAGCMKPKLIGSLFLFL